MRRNLSLNRTSGVSLAIFIAVYQPKVFIHRFWVSPAGFHSDFEVRSGNIALPVDIVEPSKGYKRKHHNRKDTG